MMRMIEQPAWAGLVSCLGAGWGLYFSVASSSVLGNPQSSWYQWVQDKDVKAEAKPILLGKMSFPSPLESPDGPCTNGWLDLDHCLHPVSESVSCLVWSSALFIFEAPAPTPTLCILWPFHTLCSSSSLYF